MKKLLKIIGIIIALIIIVLILAIAYVALFLDPNSFKATIESHFKKATGREIKIPGKLSWSFFPSISLSTGKIAILNPHGFGQKTFAKIDKAKIDISLFALLGGNLDIKDVVVKGMHLNLVEKANGQTNWNLTPSHSTTAKAEKAKESKQPKQTTQSSAPSFGAINIPKLNISDTNISYQNFKTGQHIAIKNFQATTKPGLSSGIPLNASFNIENTKPKTSGKISLSANLIMNGYSNTFKLNQLDFTTAIKSEQFNNKLVRFNLKGNVTLTSKGMKIDKLILQLNKNKLSGNVDVKDLGNYDATFNLKSDRLDAANILPAQKQTQPKSSGKSSQPTTAAAPSNEKIALPPILKQLNVKGQLLIKELVYNRLSIQNVKLNVNTHKGVLDIPLSATIYKGKLNSSTVINDQGQTPAFQSTIALSGVDMQPLFKALSGKDNVSGQFNFNSNITTNGDTQLALRQHLNGQARFNLQNGVVRGIDIAYYFQVARALSRHESKPDQKGANETTFGNFSGTFNIQNGIASNNDLSLTNPAFNLSGHGKINFVNEKYDDYRLDVKAKDGTVIPLIVKGSIQKPQVELDMGELLKNAAKKTLGNELKKVFGGGHIHF